MKKFKILNQPTRIGDLGFDDNIDYYDSSALRAEKLQARELRKFRHQTA